MTDPATLARIEAFSHLLLVIPALFSFSGLVRSNWHARRARRLAVNLRTVPPPANEIGALRQRITIHEERARLLLDLTTLLPRWAMWMLGVGLTLRLLIALARVTGYLPV